LLGTKPREVVVVMVLSSSFSAHHELCIGEILMEATSIRGAWKYLLVVEYLTFHTSQFYTEF
jgi:hypothetical protein